ncbi:MAG TPA: hypothetical protein VGO52_02860, partial [Hyphomonadaceae bacterium]|nr:hypothetical protein [Hyphomonadaceae bacterium]
RGIATGAGPLAGFADAPPFAASKLDMVFPQAVIFVDHGRDRLISGGTDLQSVPFSGDSVKRRQLSGPHPVRLLGKAPREFT